MRLILFIVSLCLISISVCYLLKPATVVTTESLPVDAAIAIYKAGYMSGHYRGVLHQNIDSTWIKDSTEFSNYFHLPAPPKKDTIKPGSLRAI